MCFCSGWARWTRTGSLQNRSSGDMRSFLYMPLMHAESLDTQANLRTTKGKSALTSATLRAVA